VGCVAILTVARKGSKLPGAVQVGRIAKVGVGPPLGQVGECQYGHAARQCSTHAAVANRHEVGARARKL